MQQLLLKIFGARKRHEIRKGKLWEITRILGIDLLEVELVPAQPKEFVKPDALEVDKMRVHIIKPPDNMTNLTKNPELL